MDLREEKRRHSEFQRISLLNVRVSFDSCFRSFNCGNWEVKRQIQSTDPREWGVTFEGNEKARHSRGKKKKEMEKREKELEFMPHQIFGWVIKS